MASTIAKGQKKLAHVDTLRGVAILLVILVHTSQRMHVPHETYLLASYGQMGVQLFFVLSAYTLCLSMDRRGKESSLLPFYLRRYFRVAPLYYFGILFYALPKLALGYNDTELTLVNIASNFLFVHGFHPAANNTVVPGGWSIGAEMAFYLVFPLVFLLYKRYQGSKSRVLAAPLLGLALCFSAVYLFSSHLGYEAGNNTFLYYNLLNQLPVFLIGVSYYFYERYHGNGLGSAAPLSVLGFVAATAAGVWVFLYCYDMTLAPFLAGLSFVFLINLAKARRGFNLRALRRIGQLSYSMYVFHFGFAWFVSPLVAEGLAPYLSPNLVFLVCFAQTVLATALVAIVSERTIEAYGTAVGKGLMARITSDGANWLPGKGEPDAPRVRREAVQRAYRH